MRPWTAILGVLLALGLSSCAGSAPPAKGDCCCAKEQAKPMTCDKKEHAGGCCPQGGAKTPAERHPH